IRLGPVVIGTDRATCRHGYSDPPRRPEPHGHPSRIENTHRYSPLAGCPDWVLPGPVRKATTSPSASDSAGFNTMLSFCVTPLNIATVLPKSVPNFTAFNVTRPAPSTVATRGPSGLNNKTLVGTTRTFIS